MQGFRKRVLSMVPYVICDIFLFNFSVIFSIFLRFDMDVADKSFIHYIENYSETFWIYSVLSVVVYTVFRVYKTLFKQISLRQIIKGVIVSTLSSVSLYLSCVIMGVGQPRTVYAFMFVLNFTSERKFKLTRA